MREKERERERKREKERFISLFLRYPPAGESRVSLGVRLRKRGGGGENDVTKVIFVSWGMFGKIRRKWHEG